MQRPLIFISNDDGVSAKGIQELTRFLQPLGDIVVMAPTEPRSGQSCAITAADPVSYHLVSEAPGVKIYACTGTPVDCIKLAYAIVLDREPDVIVSGINHGDNSGVNVHYSGTMGVVIEGCLKGTPSVGFSLCDHAHDAHFQPLEKHIQQIVSGVLSHGLPDRTCLNVNFPVGEIKGMKVCEQAVGQWVREWEPCSNGVTDQYLLTGEFVNTQPDNELADHWALTHGYAAITPTTVNMTDYVFLATLKELIL